MAIKPRFQQSRVCTHNLSVNHIGRRRSKLRNNRVPVSDTASTPHVFRHLAPTSRQERGGTATVVVANVVHVSSLGDPGHMHMGDVAQQPIEIRIVPGALPVAFASGDVHRVEAHQGRSWPEVAFGQGVTINERLLPRGRSRSSSVAINALRSHHGRPGWCKRQPGVHCC